MRKLLIFLKIFVILAFFSNGTLSYFTDVEKALGEIHAGFIDLKLSLDGCRYHDGVGAFIYEDDLKPGWSTSGKIYLKKARGSNSADEIEMKFRLRGDACYFASFLKVEELEFVMKNRRHHVSWNLLDERFNVSDVNGNGYIDLCDLSITGVENIRPALNGKPHCKENKEYMVFMTVKLVENAPNDLQGKKVTFDVDFTVYPEKKNPDS